VKVSEAARKMIMHHEGVRFKPYKCPADLWTVGVGSVLYPEQNKLPMVRKDGYTGQIRKDYALHAEDNRVWSKEEVMALLEKDLGRFERGVVRYCPSVLGHQAAFDAFVSLSFNIGLGAFQRSSVRMRHNRGDYQGAADAFMMWTKAGPRVLPGLVKRRKDERELYLSDYGLSET
jgi:lysozyme